MTKIDFNAYAAQLAREQGRQTMAPVIEKELLHYEILRAMEEDGLLESLVLQGGTCLRLCYGALRYSEDLDFAGGFDFNADDLGTLKACIERALPERYRVVANVREPAPSESLVKKWRIRVDTTPSRPDIASQKISLEVASIPAYTKRPRMLQLNYEGLPSSYEDVVLFAESLEEILADKLEAFVCSQHIRYRDIWDMHWLMRRAGIDLEEACQLRSKKELDYGEQERFSQGLSKIKNDLPSLIESTEFRQHMKRFLPSDRYERTIERPAFRVALTESVRELYERCSTSQ
ncbi:nucleotidyl transferase AbiEii/AbiGii toxin family protein [Eggerthella sinensis]|uniref:nucleotidyl transferase AbiEii/AbiGii toxin family protein n=1 Tax=Eggerthella sinensis TaxID=242230 RepID=UPI0022E21EAC|nr:nucleotidyl transferase AbiEii/AbiGii toxin family protein [Eggerthella sinensis]